MITVYIHFGVVLLLKIMADHWHETRKIRRTCVKMHLAHKECQKGTL